MPDEPEWKDVNEGGDAPAIKAQLNPKKEP